MTPMIPIALLFCAFAMPARADGPPPSPLEIVAGARKVRAWDAYRGDCLQVFSASAWLRDRDWLAGYGLGPAEASETAKAIAVARACRDASAACVAAKERAGESACRSRWQAARRLVAGPAPVSACRPKEPALSALLASHDRLWNWDALVGARPAESYDVGCLAYAIGLYEGRRPGGDCSALAGLPPYKWSDPAPYDTCLASRALAKAQAAAASGRPDRAACLDMIAHVGRFEKLTARPDEFCAAFERGLRLPGAPVTKTLLAAKVLDVPNIYAQPEPPEHLLMSFFGTDGAECAAIRDAPKRRQCAAQARFAVAAGDAAKSARAFAAAEADAARWYCELAAGVSR